VERLAEITRGERERERERERVGFNWDASVALESGAEEDDEGGRSAEMNGS
jgi:hypothetical protein